MKWDEIPAAAVKNHFDPSDAAYGELQKSLSNHGVTLLLGSGATRCLEGDWAELLDEMAIMHCGRLRNKRPDDIRNLRSFIRRHASGGKFLPSGTNVLEQGEYLLFDPKDSVFRQWENPEEAKRWQETYYAARVREAMNVLRGRKLKDGGGKHPRKMEEDFLAWVSDAPDPAAFGISRRALGSRKAIVKSLESVDTQAMLDQLQNQYGIRLALEALSAAVADESRRGEEKIRLLRDEFQLEKDQVDRAIRETVCGAADICALLLNGGSADRRMEDIHARVVGGCGDLLRKLLMEKTAALIKRPDYATLHAVLALCLKYKIRRVVSYNFDTVFEELLSSSDVREALGTTEDVRVQLYSFFQTQPVDLDGFYQGTPDEHTIRVDHVHGILHHDMDQIHPVIFSENSYRSYQDNSLNWSNRVLSQALSQSDLFCVGFSGTDANFRHLVRLHKKTMDGPFFAEERMRRIYLAESMEKMKNHYDGKDKILAKEEKQFFFDCLEENLDMVEQYYGRQFNAFYIWAKDYADMAERILNL